MLRWKLRRFFVARDAEGSVAARLLSTFMLRFLSIQHLAVIESVEIDFDTGLNILTGETGAGKSILVEAVGLLLGARASSDLVRTGEDVATIQAIFDAGGEEVIVRREITSSGRSRAFVNGALATAGALRELASRLIEMHGQHEHQGLLVPESHLDLLDTYAGLDPLREEVGALYQRMGALRAERDTLRLDERQKLARVDLLTFQRDEISKAAPRPGEDLALEAERHVLANAERLVQLSGEAYQALYEQDGAVLSGLAAVWKRVGDLAALDPRATAYLDARGAIQSQLEDLAYFLRDYADGIDASPGRLQEVEDRLALLDRLKRKHGPSLDDVLAHAAQCERELETLASADERAADVDCELRRAEADYQARAEALSAKRRTAAPRFAADVISVAAGLAMDRLRFEIRFEASDKQVAWGPKGLDIAEFFVSPNPGEDLRPLARIVSGGELSRLMLAIKTVTAQKGRGATLIFDEVDAGIGGHTADVVGRRLQALGGEYQVLCITHLPQIAAHGDVHFRIVKAVRGGRTTTSVARLNPEDRRLEIARMIAGHEPSAGVLASAGEMLESRGRLVSRERPRRGAKGEATSKGESERRRAKGRM
jgi:DNA repair protein RecN (Recombination protein N)